MDWYLSKRDDDDEFTLRREDGSVAGWLEDFSPEDAQLVLRAVNTNDQLVQALEHSLEVMCEPWVLGEVRCEADCGCPIHEARAALAAARGEGE